jgi:hypothetical protein
MAPVHPLSGGQIAETDETTTRSWAYWRDLNNPVGKFIMRTLDFVGRSAFLPERARSTPCEFTDFFPMMHCACISGRRYVLDGSGNRVSQGSVRN